MTMMIKLISLNGLLLLLVLIALPSSVLGQSPWKWQMSLRVEKSGDSMYMPSAIAFDESSGRYYVVDTGRNRLISYEKDGTLLKAFTANEQLRSPFDMVRLNSGKLWVVEKGRNSLTMIDIAARKVQPNTLRDGKHLVFPDRLSVGGGKLHVLDRSSGQVLRLAEDLSVEKRFGCPECSGGFADFVISGDSILAIEPRDKKIYRFKPDGTVAQEFELGEEVDFPISLDIGPSGFFFVLDRHQNSVLAYDEEGRFRYRFLESGQSAGKVYYARQIRFDPWDRICVVDEGNGRVEIYSR